MSAFGGLILTNKGKVLQSKAQTGTQLNFTRIAVGDGELGSSSILDLNTLKNQIKSLSITKLENLQGGKAVLGCILTNADLQTGFYWREVGVFAQDPDVGEILYCYGNAGINSEYIPATGGADVVEKSIDIVTIVGNATSVTATLNSAIQVSSVNAKTGDVVLGASDVGAVPLTRKVNNKVLSEDITLSASDIKTSSGATVESSLSDLATEVNNINTDITSVNNNISDIQVKLNNYNSYASGKDSNGIFTVVEYKRSDNTLYMKSTLSNADINGNYQTDTWQFYDNTGTTVIATKTWTITYDANNKITSKVVA